MIKLANKIEEISGVSYVDYEVEDGENIFYIYLNKDVDVSKCITKITNKIEFEHSTHGIIITKEEYDVVMVIIKDVKIDRESLIDDIVRISGDEMDLKLALYLAKLGSEGLKNYYNLMNISR